MNGVVEDYNSVDTRTARPTGRRSAEVDAERRGEVRVAPLASELARSNTLRASARRRNACT